MYQADGAGGRRPGAARGADARDRAPLQPPLPAARCFPEPRDACSPTAARRKLPGTDGRKMSKSLRQHHLLSEPETSVRQKLKTMVTDPARMRRTDPGQSRHLPGRRPAQDLQSQETMAKSYEGCRTAGIGCIECKKWAADSLWNVLRPIQERREKYEANPKLAWDILEDGSAKARAAAEYNDGRGPCRRASVVRIRAAHARRSHVRTVIIMPDQPQIASSTTPPDSPRKQAGRRIPVLGHGWPGV